jgi:CRISPR-associated protein Cas6
MPVVFARYVVADPKQSEETFLDAAITQMQQMGIQCRKALCGRNHHFRLPDGDLFTRSLMIADLEPQQSITLQQQGLGKWRKMGCGLFVPHKGIGV